VPGTAGEYKIAIPWLSMTQSNHQREQLPILRKVPIDPPTGTRIVLATDFKSPVPP
jgi:hypothetical protein